MAASDPQAVTANASVGWDAFNSDKYFEDNYSRLLREDHEIIQIVADHFLAYASAHRWRVRTRAIDVGSGTNLYPALTMLPFADEVVLFEHADPNCTWLKKQLSQPAESWTQFWEAIVAEREVYQRIKKPFDQLHDRAEVTKGNVFALSPASYDMGTMFFVAESITTLIPEFERATSMFVASLTAKAPFATAFMKDSSGYMVGKEWFPACAINKDHVRRCLSDIALIDDIREVESHLHEGYDNMIVATGRKK